MPDASLLEVLCKKLGHGLEEVRVRALDSILSKLDRGFLQIGDLTTTKDFLVKLLEWFGLEPRSRQHQVLRLILQILQDKDANRLVAQIGADRILLALNTIREELPAELCSSLDEIAALVHHAQAIQSQCDDDGFECSSTPGESVEKHSIKNTGPSDGNVIDASLQEALQQQTDSQISTDPVYSCRGTAPVEALVTNDVFKHLLLPWQPLLSTDRHVLVAVQESLVNSGDRPQLLHTCNFLVDVMMRDFPAEVFLQRPTIVLTFMHLLNSSLLSNDQTVAKMIISCLTTLTIALRSRIRFYQDPNMANFKQEKFPLMEEDTASQSSADQSFSNQNDGDEVDCGIQAKGTEWSHYSPNPSESSAASQAPSQPTSLRQTDENVDRFNYNSTQANSNSVDSEDSVFLKHQQCSLPQFCILAMRHVLPHVDFQPDVCALLSQLSQLLTECVSPQLWFAPASDIVAADIATHFHEVLGIFGEVLQQDRSHTISRLTHIHLLAVIRHLLQHIIPVEVSDRCIPRQLKTALCLTLLDGPLHAFFPVLHSDLLQYAQMFKNVHDMDSVKLFDSTLSMAESLSHAAKLLNKVEPTDGPKFVRSSECALSALSFHRNLSFIPLVFNNCSKYFYIWELSDGDRQALSAILLKLLAHADMEVRVKAYSCLHQLVLSVLSVQCPPHPPAAALSFLLFDTAMLLEIVTHGVSNTNNVVQQSAEDILLHILKGRMLLGKSQWTRFMSCLLPVMPLLQCWGDRPSAFGRVVSAMFNPDVGTEMNLETLELFKGNLRFLFSPDESIRGEALSRTVWLLTREENAFDKVPHIADLHNCVSERIFLLDRPIDILQSVPEKPFYQESSLLQVLEIVHAEKVEPLILLSAMSQLAVMLEDPRLHESFLSRDGLQIIIRVLHAAISDKHFAVLPETVVPAVSVLKSFSFHHSITRHKLSKDTNVFFSVMRGLMLLPSDTRLRVNACQLLCLLSYSDVLISSSAHTTSDGTVVRSLSIPDLISRRMKLPFACPTHWRTSHFTEPLMTDVLLQNEACRVFLATAWNLSVFKEKQSLLLWTAGKPLPPEVTVGLESFSKSLHLNDRHLRVLQATALLNTCHRQLNEIKAAATHNDVAKALSVLDSVLSLYFLIRTRREVICGQVTDVNNFEKQYKSLPWRSAFRRFLMAAPASLDDQKLLICILQFLQTHVQILQCLGNCETNHLWLLNLLKQPTQPLPNLFQSVAHTGYAGDTEMPHELAHLPKWKGLCKELLFLVAECACLEQDIPKGLCSVRALKREEENKRVTSKGKKRNKGKLFGENAPNELERAENWVDKVVSNASEEDDCSQDSGWIHVIQSVVSCLKSSDSQQFYNLAYLDWLLWALVHLTGTTGWCTGLREAEIKALFSELITVLLELIQAFHSECGKGGRSCMGLSITRAAALCLNHVLVEMQQCRQLKEWEPLWDQSASKRGNAAWLLSLLQSREPVVRAAAMQLAAGIATTTKGCQLVVNIFSREPDVWMPALCILLDHEEASLVRERAANVLTNFVEKSIPGHSSSVCQLNFEILQQRLVESDFLSDLWLALECLSLANCCDPHNLIVGPAGISLKHWTVGSAVDGSVAHLPSDQHILVLNHQSYVDSEEPSQVRSRTVSCTPAFLKSMFLFIDTVMSRSHETLLIMAKQHIASQLFRCIGPVPSFEFQNTRQALLYCDTVQMYSGICRILSRCASSDAESCHKLLQQPDIIHNLLILLDPTLFCTKTKPMQKLCEQLWTEVLFLISSVFCSVERQCLNGNENWYSAFHSTLLRSRGEPLVSVIMLALSSSIFTELQRAALACTQSILSHPASKKGQPFADLMDNTDIDLDSSVTTEPRINLKNSIGADICHSLLALYDIHSLQINSLHQQNNPDVHVGWRAQRLAVIGALSSLFEVSSAAKQVAVNQGLVELLYTQLSEIQSHLTMEPGETMKRLASKKKVCPILQDIELLFGLLNSMASENTQVKQLAADVGVTDVMHKLWVWCLHHPSLLVSALTTLATLTSGCHSASHSLVLTTTVPGLGLRRSSSAQSLLHALVALVLQEAELGIGSHDLTVLSIACSVLLNSCHVPECRTILAKSNLLRVANLLSSSTKRKNQWKVVENMWLKILMQFSAYQEGQNVIPKVPDMLDYLLHLARGQKTNNNIALQILRNVSFSHVNRPRLLGSAEFVQVINKKLCEGDTDEQVAAAAAVWALTANNQKGKLVVKCSGTDVQILDALRKLAVCHRPGADYVAQLLNCVLRVLRSEPNIS